LHNIETINIDMEIDIDLDGATLHGPGFMTYKVLCANLDRNMSVGALHWMGYFLSLSVILRLKSLYISLNAAITSSSSTKNPGVVNDVLYYKRAAEIPPSTTMFEFTSGTLRALSS